MSAVSDTVDHCARSIPTGRREMALEAGRRLLGITPP
jgi:hypothetical protein